MYRDSCTIHSIKSFMGQIVQALREADAVNLWIKEEQQNFTMHFSSIPLTNKERIRADLFAHPSDRDSFIFRRKLLKAILATCTSLNIVEIPTCGKISSKNGDFYFSHSNKNNSLWYSFSTCCAIGADLEEENANVDCDAIAKLFFCEQERFTCQKDTPHFFRSWTQKEALAKCAKLTLYQALQIPITDHKNNLALARIADRDCYIYSQQKSRYHISIAAMQQLATMKTYEQELYPCQEEPDQKNTTSRLS